MAKENPYEEPWYHGSVCTFGSQIDEETYLTLNTDQKQRYILDTLHATLMKLAVLQQWDQSIFEQANRKIVESHLHFQKVYPPKLSEDKKYTAQAVLDKTPEKSKISIHLSHQGTVNKGAFA